MKARPVKYPLGSLSRVEAKTFGEPGHRTFQLAIEAGQVFGTVWLEKEQLFQLGLYLREAVQSLSETDKQLPSQLRDPDWSGEGVTIDFKAGQFLSSHDTPTSSFYMLAYEIEDTEPPESGRESSTEPSPGPGEERSSVSFWITTEQAVALSEEAIRICAAGRPRCFLCGLPIDPEGHVCPRSNGHTVYESG